jgi:N-acetylglucosaminyl-diphospho-decaprenol L-rhamnosyltransferase
MIQADYERVTIITVSYNSAGVMKEMLDSIPAGTPTIVVDNASADVDCLETICATKNVQLIRNGVNEGFGAACNRGAARARTEFLFFLNPDAVLLPGALDRLCTAADRYPHCTGFNPRIEDNDGEPSFRCKSDLLPRSEWMSPGWPEADCEIPIFSGAALFVRRAEFEAVGGFDERIFLYYDDDDLALTLRRRGPLMFVHDARVRHAIGSSSGSKSETAAMKAWHMGYSRVHVSRKHRVRFSRMLPLLSAAFKLLSPAMIISPKRRAECLARLNGVVNAILDSGRSGRSSRE